MKRIRIVLLVLCLLSFLFSFALWISHYQDTLSVLISSTHPIDIVFDGFDETDVNESRDTLLEKGYGQGTRHFIRDQVLTNPYTIGMVFSFMGVIVIMVITTFYSSYKEKRNKDKVLEALKDGQVIDGDPFFDTMESIRKQYQSRLKDMALDHDSQNQELENIAHQMKSTLSTILLHVDQISDKGNENHKELIVNQVNRCNDALNHFLKGYDVRSNLTNYHYEIKNITECVRSAINQVDYIASHKGLTIHSKLEDCTMALDVFWIQEAMETLLVNAIESAYPNSIINVNVKKVSNELQILIINKGDCPKDIQTMFVRYNSSRRNQEHYGIGLHMVQTVCKNHMGHISASYQDKKMIIKIVLPLHRLESITYSQNNG